MPYCTLDDLKKKIDDARLIELTDTVNNPPTTIDTARIVQAIQDADAFIDSHAAGKYNVPMTPVPHVVRDCSATLTVYFLHLFRSLEPEVWRNRYEDATKWLAKVANGQVQLDGVIQEPDPSGDNVASFTADERVFSRDTLKGF